MKKIVAALIGSLALLADGCTPAKTADDVRADARIAVVTVEAAWKATAQSCVDVAAMHSDQALLNKCASVLDPVRQQLIAADAIINGWTDASNAGSLSDTLASVIKALNEAVAIEGVALPVSIADAEKFALVLLADVGTKATDGGHE